MCIFEKITCFKTEYNKIYMMSYLYTQRRNKSQILSIATENKSPFNIYYISNTFISLINYLVLYVIYTVARFYKKITIRKRECL